jgi:large subunit ribosomal protein L33
MATKRADNLIGLKCTVCNRRNFYTSRNKKKVERKIELMKFCPWDRKSTLHKEARITGK